ncbi:MAG TPA: hypothetical protein VF266_02790 [Thermoanaerobaculia bacterium]
MSDEQKRHLFPFALIAVIALPLFLGPLLRGEVFTLRDHFDYFQPLRWFTAVELQEGRIPLWNPYNAGGEPWLANPQTGVFYPPAWLFVVLPFAAAYVLFLYLHVVLLGWGAYLLFARGASQGAALVGAVALMFCGPALSLLDVSNNLATLAWIPLALWCAAEGAWRRGGAALALAFLAGEPFFAAVGALLYAGRAAARLDRLKPVLRLGDRLKPVVRSALVAFGLSAVQLFPFLEMLRNSDRAAGLDRGLILMHSMSWSDWLRFVIPIERGATQQFIPAVYTGVVVCALALLGIRRRTWPWLLLFVVSAVISFGPEWLVRLPLTLFRYPARLVPLAAFAVAALAVAGWERVRPNRRWVDLVLVLLVVVDLAPRAWPLLVSAPFRRDVVPYGPVVGEDSKFLRAGTVDAHHRTAWIAGYLNLYDRRFDASTAAPVASDAWLRVHRGLLENPTREELARKGIGWVVSTHDLRSAFMHVTAAEGVSVYRNHTTLPHAFLITRSPLDVRPVRAAFDTSHVRVSVEAPREGVIAVLQQRAPGWEVSIDGVPAREFPIDTFFRGVQVTRGYHEIVWKYRPRSLYFGAAVTAITLLFCFVKRAR